MRRVEWLFGLGALLVGVVAAAGLVEGCTAPLGDCSKYAHVGCAGYGGSGTGDGGTSDGGMGDAGGDAGCASCPPVPAGPCASLGTVTCTGGVCGVAYTHGDAPSQVYGNCQKNVCDTAGKMTSIADDTNVYETGEACVAYACLNGVRTGNTVTPGTACSLAGSQMGVCESGVATMGLSCMDCGGTQTACTSSPEDISPCNGPTPRCWQHMCVPSTCGDCMKNGGETDVDCGGSQCVPCAAGKACMVASDCASHFCINQMCLAPSCSDGAQDGDETDVDCGGTSCSACLDGKTCALPSDCQSGVCAPSDGGPLTCQAPTCTDGVKNGTETGVDCGGTGDVDGGAPCPPCPQ